MAISSGALASSALASVDSSFGSSQVSAADTLAVGLADSGQVTRLNFAASDTLGVACEDQGARSTPIAGTDQATVQLGETSLLNIVTGGRDPLWLRISESASVGLWVRSATDSLVVALDDPGALRWIVVGTDAADVAWAEGAFARRETAAGEAVVTGLGEALGLSRPAAAGDSLALLLVEVQQRLARLAHGENVSLSLQDAGLVWQPRAGVDGLLVSWLEAGSRGRVQLIGEDDLPVRSPGLAALRSAWSLADVLAAGVSDGAQIRSAPGAVDALPLVLGEDGQNLWRSLPVSDACLLQTTDAGVVARTVAGAESLAAAMSELAQRSIFCLSGDALALVVIEHMSPEVSLLHTDALQLDWAELGIQHVALTGADLLRLFWRELAAAKQGLTAGEILTVVGVEVARRTSPNEQRVASVCPRRLGIHARPGEIGARAQVAKGGFVARLR